MDKQRSITAVHHFGFRPFFLLAGLYAVVAMVLWLWGYHLNPANIHNDVLPDMVWHAHSMIYGYGLAVIAGFLLTAVSNWTGVQTLHGRWLISLSVIWILARIMPYLDYHWSLYGMVFLDLMFNTWLSIAILIPIIKVKQWTQMGVWSKVVLLLVSNALFYSGVFGLVEQGVQWGLYAGFYLIISLILMMGRRVIPFFIEKGIEDSASLKNPGWVDLGSLILMLLFVVIEVFTQLATIASIIALLLALLHGYRLKLWYNPGLWHRPLLWVLYIAYGWIVLGFSLKAVAIWIPVNPMLAIHAFAVGGIGLMTVGMMARVTLGHTGRNVFDPPVMLKYLFALLILAGISRVLLPMLLPGYYQFWIGISQISWIISFALFIWVYTPMLLKPRVDGKYG